MGKAYELSRGGHGATEGKRCAAEWVAYLAGEAHTDNPRCMSPILREFVIWLNDDLPKRTRQKLRPYLARMIGTRGDGHDDARLMAFYAYVHGTPLGEAFTRPVNVEIAAKAKAIGLLQDRPQRLEGVYYARAAARIAASRREVPRELMEELLPTVALPEPDVLRFVDVQPLHTAATLAYELR